MTMDLFNQFASPTLLSLPLIIPAMFAPWIFLETPCNRWIPNRLLALQEEFLKMLIKQIFLPLNTPAHKWALMFVALNIFLSRMNYFGLAPYTFTPTTQLSLNLGLAIPFWFATVIIGFRNQPSSSLAHLLPEGTPTTLIPIMIIIETISLFIRPLALGVRLTANLTAGHLLIQLVSTATLTLTSSPMLMTMTFLALLLLSVLEIAVAMIQSYVFVLLLSLYLQENT